MDYLEVSAKTVDDAITKACVELGLSSDQLDIQIISEGSAGFLGIGSKPAVIQVRRKEDEVAAEPEAGKAAAEELAPEEKKQGGESKKASSKGQGRRRGHKAAVAEAAPAEGENVAGADEKPARREKKEVIPERSAEEIVTIKAAASQFLDGVFKAMDLPVGITIDYEAETGSLNVDMEGDDMGILIGKRGQTLDSLQYLTSLVVNKDQKDYVRVKLDTEDYRKRRKDTLENLAKNIASKVRRTGRAVSLEAMNPYERRIIHSALQGNNSVQTYSEGNEPYRHVVVVPKKGE